MAFSNLDESFVKLKEDTIEKAQAKKTMNIQIQRKFYLDIRLQQNTKMQKQGDSNLILKDEAYQTIIPTVQKEPQVHQQIDLFKQPYKSIQVVYY